jgi:hypothetical protein
MDITGLMNILHIKLTDHSSHLANNYHHTFKFWQRTHTERARERESLAGKWNYQYNHTY